MTIDVLPAFIGAVAVIVAVPGPNVLLVINDSMVNGFRKSLATIVGIKVGTLFLIFLSLAGVVTLLMLYSGLFMVLKMMGAGYLLYLGVSLLRSSSGATDPALREQQSLSSLFVRGVLVSATNPKGILFAAAFFPQFVSNASPLLPQLASLTIWFLVTASAVEGLYAYLAHKAASLIRSPSFSKAVSRISGAIFILFGLWLLTTQKAP